MIIPYIYPYPLPSIADVIVPPVIHNKLGSLSEVQNSVIGADGSTTGTVTYSSGQHGNSAYTGTLRSNRIIFNDGNDILIDNDVFTRELWMKPTFACTNGNAGATYLISGTTDDGTVSGSTRDDIVFSTASYLYINNQQIFLNTGFTFLANVWQHFAFVKDVNGIDGGSDTFRVYINNVLVWSTTVAITQTNNTIKSFVLGSYDEVTGTSAGAQTYFDNVKVYDYAKTDFSDRFDE